MVFDKWAELRVREFISIKDIDDLMYAVEKLLMNYDQTVDSRKKWREKYEELKNAKK